MDIPGLFGFKLNEKYYLIWNQFNSSPTELGNKLLQEIHWGNLQLWRNLLESGKVKEVHMDSHITEMDIENLKRIHIPHSHRQNDNPFASEEEEEEDIRSVDEALNWFELLERFQGSFTSVLRSGYLLNEAAQNYNPRTNSQFKGYQYILDFDGGKFEVFEGDRLRGEYPLTNLPGDLSQPMVM